jgi:hypothetical protein
VPSTNAVGEQHHAKELVISEDVRPPAVVDV